MTIDGYYSFGFCLFFSLRGLPNFETKVDPGQNYEVGEFHSRPFLFQCPPSSYRRNRAFCLVHKEKPLLFSDFSRHSHFGAHLPYTEHGLLTSTETCILCPRHS